MFMSLCQSEIQQQVSSHSYLRFFNRNLWTRETHDSMILRTIHPHSGRWGRRCVLMEQYRQFGPMA